MDKKAESTEIKNKPLMLRRTRYLQEECRNKSTTQWQHENSELEHNSLRAQENQHLGASAASGYPHWLLGLAGFFYVSGIFCFQAAGCPGGSRDVSNCDGLSSFQSIFWLDSPAQMRTGDWPKTMTHKPDQPNVTLRRGLHYACTEPQ